MKQATFETLPLNEYVELRRLVSNYVYNQMLKDQDQLPTFALIGKRFSLTMPQVEQICADCEALKDRELHVNIGVMVNGCGCGVATFDELAQYTVESDEAWAKLDEPRAQAEEDKNREFTLRSVLDDQTVGKIRKRIHAHTRNRINKAAKRPQIMALDKIHDVAIFIEAKGSGITVRAAKILRGTGKHISATPPKNAKTVGRYERRAL